MSLQLKDQFVTAIKEDLELQGAIAKATGKNIQAPLQWAKGLKHDKLTMLSTLKAIAAYKQVKNYMDLVEDKAA